MGQTFPRKKTDSCRPSEYAVWNLGYLGNFWRASSTARKPVCVFFFLLVGTTWDAINNNAAVHRTSWKVRETCDLSTVAS